MNQEERQRERARISERIRAAADWVAGAQEGLTAARAFDNWNGSPSLFDWILGTPAERAERAARRNLQRALDEFQAAQNEWDSFTIAERWGDV